MNNARRKELKEAIETITATMGTVEAVKDEEQESFDNMPESLQCTEKGEASEQHIEELDSIFDELTDLESRIQTIIDNELV